uniref:Uncharacterized protein n=1 Tax=Rhizophora mucronata TaxID=61149 RepID=A0A2P2PJV1_RHIMU
MIVNNVCFAFLVYQYLMYIFDLYAETM